MEWFGNSPITAWDVGAHEGEWAEETHHLLANAKIHSFEILKPTADRLSAKLGGADWLTVHNLGLSDRVGTVPVVWTGTHPMTSAIAPRLESRFFTGSELKMFDCEVRTIDSLISEGLAAPDLLKIDVEGHEAAVIKGETAFEEYQCACAHPVRVRRYMVAGI